VSEAVPEALQIDVAPGGEAEPALVVLSGEMDIVSTAAFADAMSELESSSPDRVVIDIAGLTFIDSSGINALVQAARAIEARGGRAVLASPAPHVQRVFEITRVGDVVAIAADRDEAARLAAMPLGQGAAADER
jgi:anti-sigma B factor antagonist